MTGAPATLIAFDYGQRRIGVAVGQTLTGTASPLGVVPVRRSAPDWVEITRLVRVWEPEALVVGLPYTMDGGIQDMTRLARRFARQLHHRYRLPVHLCDERLSTREARTRLHEQGRGDQDDDPVAAQIILEDWLNERRGQ